MAVTLKCMIFIVLVSQFAEQLYDPKSEVCCRGKIHPVAYEDQNNILCCGNETNDWEISRCCDGKAVMKPKSPRGVFVCWECCGDTWFDWRIFLKERKFGCCKNKLFNLTQETCNPRTGQILNKEVDKCLDLCSTSYNSELSVCCDGIIYPSGFSAQACCTPDTVNLQNEVSYRVYNVGQDPENDYGEE